MSVTRRGLGAAPPAVRARWLMTSHSSRCCTGSSCHGWQWSAAGRGAMLDGWRAWRLATAFDTLVFSVHRVSPGSQPRPSKPPPAQTGEGCAAVRAEPLPFEPLRHSTMHAATRPPDDRGYGASGHAGCRGRFRPTTAGDLVNVAWERRCLSRVPM
jgi:hypothetical protein